MKRSTIIASFFGATCAGAAYAHGEGERFVEVATTFLGHPVHPIAVVFPLALFPVALLFDLVYLWRRDDFWRRAAFYVILIGLLGGLAAAGLGFADYFIALPKSGEVHESATTHWQWAAAGLGVFLVNLLLRLRRGTPTGGMLALTTMLSVTGAALIWTAGFYGGHLVFDEKVGVIRMEEGHSHGHGD